MYWSSLHCGQIWHKQNSSRNIQFQVPDIYILYLAKKSKSLIPNYNSTALLYNNFHRFMWYNMLYLSLIHI